MSIDTPVRYDEYYQPPLSPNNPFEARYGRWGRMQKLPNGCWVNLNNYAQREMMDHDMHMDDSSYEGEEGDWSRDASPGIVLRRPDGDIWRPIVPDSPTRQVYCTSPEEMTRATNRKAEKGTTSPFSTTINWGMPYQETIDKELALRFARLKFIVRTWTPTEASLHPGLVTPQETSPRPTAAAAPTIFLHKGAQDEEGNSPKTNEVSYPTPADFARTDPTAYSWICWFHRTLHDLPYLPRDPVKRVAGLFAKHFNIPLSEDEAWMLGRMAVKMDRAAAKFRPTPVRNPRSIACRRSGREMPPLDLNARPANNPLRFGYTVHRWRRNLQRWSREQNPNFEV